MSLVIYKFDSGGKLPTLYKRGNEDINLDSFANEATIELLNRLANSKLKDKEKKAVQTEFSRILLGMYDGTFTYRIGGGYNNTVGMVNAEKGFDAPGIAAGILGDILRNQTVYKAPEEKPDTSKLEWKGNSSVRSSLINNIFGSNTPNINDFVGLDYDPTTKTVTGQAKRAERLLQGLENIYNNFYTIYTDADSAYLNYGNDLKRAREILKDGSITENEYLDLVRITGISNIRDWLGNSYKTPLNYDVKPANTKVYNSEEEYRQITHPRSTVTLIQRPLTTRGLYAWQYRSKLIHALDTLTEKLFLALIKEGLKYKSLDNTNSNVGLELNNISQIVNEFGGQAPTFENNYILDQALKLGKEKGYIKAFGANSNYYYIPLNHKGLDKRGTGFVYYIGEDGINKLVEMDRNDIPFFTNQWHLDWLNGQVPSNKNGGILKFESGGKTPWYIGLTDYNPDNYKSDYDTTSLVNGDMSDDDFSFWSSPNASKLLGRYLPITNYSNEFGVDKQHYKTVLDIEKQQYYQDFGNALLDENGNFTELGLKWAKATDDLLPINSKARFFDENGNLRTSWTPSGKDAHGRPLESFTGEGALARYVAKVRNDQILGARHNVFRKSGVRYFYKDTDGVKHWVDPSVIDKYTISDKPISGWNNNHTIWWDDYELTGLKNPVAEEVPEDTPAEDTSPESSDIYKKIFGTGDYNLYETGLDLKTINNNGFSNFLTNLAPDILDSGRLWASLHTNNNVYKTILPSLKPVLKNTYEKYSPVTGAFDFMLFKNTLASDVARLMYLPVTTDASLISARMLEGKLLANRLQTEGFLADDLKINQTLAAALQRQEDNTARRSDTANFNLASINQTDRERAQLKATHLKSNWQSWDNFLAGIEKRWRTRLDEDRARANSFYDTISRDKAENWYNTITDPAVRLYEAWYKEASKKDPNISPSDYPYYTQYILFMKEARARMESMIYADMANRYNLDYDNPYKGIKDNLFFKWYPK